MSIWRKCQYDDIVKDLRLNESKRNSSKRNEIPWKEIPASGKERERDSSKIHKLEVMSKPSESFIE